MILSINTNRTLITIQSTLLDLFIATPSSYTSVEVKIFQNSTTASTTETYSSTRLITSSTPVSTVAGLEYINPSFLSTTIFAQGVYHIVVTLTSPSEILTDEGCIFVSTTLPCDVNTYRLDTTHTLPERIDAGLNYYMLTKSQDCPCGCDNLIEIYNNLVTTLTNNCTTC
jgi:hypothetical protein